MLLEALVKRIAIELGKRGAIVMAYKTLSDKQVEEISVLLWVNF